MIPKYISTHTRRLALAFMLAFVMLASGVSAQNVVRVTGQVIAKGDNEPLSGVNITDASSKHAYAVTDLDGKFAFNAFNGTRTAGGLQLAQEEAGCTGCSAEERRMHRSEDRNPEEAELCSS